jgi:subtilisin family serine protease
MFRLFATGLLSGALVAGCATDEMDSAVAVDTTAAPLLGDAADSVRDEYIVVFKDEIGAEGVAAAMNRIALRSAESRIMRQYEIVPGFAARLSEEDLAAIRKSRDVKFVERNGVMRAAKIEDVESDGLDRIDQRDLPRDGRYDDCGCDGSGVNVWILDTGIRASHAEFTERVAIKHDVINDGQNGEDCNGHGTHAASIVAGAQYGVVDRVTINSVRVLNCQGTGSVAGILEGVEFVARQCAGDVVCAANMSLGGGFSQALNTAVTNAVKSGTPFAVAAGNENADACSGSPASAPAAVTVAAVDDADRKAAFSNSGPCVDLLAPGVSILGAGISSDTATQVLSGTSTASPHVCGVMAQYLQHFPNAKPAEIDEAFKKVATPGKVSGELRPGTPNLLLFNDNPHKPEDYCQERCGSRNPKVSCQCDDACTDKGDCCPDYAEFCGG